MLPISFYSHYKNTAATEELKSSVICNKSQLNEGCQIQLTYLFSADTALSNWRENAFFFFLIYFLNRSCEYIVSGLWKRWNN